jgi:hypothetical protein
MFNRDKSVGELSDALRNRAGMCRGLSFFAAAICTIGVVFGMANEAVVMVVASVVALPFVVGFWSFLAACGDVLASIADPIDSSGVER